MVVFSYDLQKNAPATTYARFQGQFCNRTAFLNLTKTIYEQLKGCIFRIRKKIYVTYLQNGSAISQNYPKTAYTKFGAYFESLQSDEKSSKPTQITQINSKPCKVSGKTDFITKKVQFISHGPVGNHSKCANPSKTEFGAYFVGLQYDDKSSNTSEITQNNLKPCKVSGKINSNHSESPRTPLWPIRNHLKRTNP